MPLIKRLSDLDSRVPALADLKDIFFRTSSRVVFASGEAREEFFKNWTEYYLEQLPESVYLAFTEDGGRVAGYLTGCMDSHAALAHVKHGSMKLFADLYERFPAHFHVNCHPEAQGKGLGSLLTDAFLKDLGAAHVSGVHVITSPTAANVKFYAKNGFDFTDERFLKGSPVLFMGKKLF